MEGADEPPPPAGAVVELNGLFERHGPRLREMIRRRLDPALGPRLGADDLLQETFLLAARRWPGRRPGPPPGYAWFYRLAMDCLIEAWRRETRAGRDPRGQLPWPDRSSQQVRLGLGAGGSTPSQGAARREDAERVRRALESLPEVERRVLEMRHFDGLSHAEAAEVLGVSEDSAAQRYVRALRRFKAQWVAAPGPQSGQAPHDRPDPTPWGARP